MWLTCPCSCDLSAHGKLEPARIDGFQWAYPAAVHDRPIFDGMQSSCEEWVRVLRLLTMWRFAKCRQAALSKLLVIANSATKIHLCDE